jgi:predicted DNA-binding protein
VKRRAQATGAEQLSVGFEGLEVARQDVGEAVPDTMRQIVSLRMPDALLERVEQVARSRGVSPSSLMRALIAAGLDRSYAAVTESTDLAREMAELRRTVDRIASRLEVSEAERPARGEAE